MKKLNILLMGLAASLCVNAANLKDLKIYVNPGHGGYDSDDRGLTVPPFASGDPEGFWESKSNLIKGLDLRDMLKSFGADVMMSRVTNTTADDRDLHEIGYEANAYGADFFFSIHSNATGTSSRVNQPLMLYRGFTAEPEWPEAKEMSAILNDQLLENRIPSWSHETPHLAGDYDFYNWGVGVGLGVLRKLTVPGMLSEGSHHDYTPETYRLLNNEYCWLEAYHFVKSVMEYFKTPEQFSTGVVGGSLYDSRLIRTEPIYNGIFYGHDKSKPVCGATVDLIDGNGAVVETYTTDQLFNGVYLFKSVAPGTYKVKVTHSDYQPYEQEVTVEANKVTYNNAALNRVRNTAPFVESYTPIWASGDAPVACNAPIKITFNWDMDTESVEKNFSITPEVEGDLRWEDSQYCLVFEPKRAYDINTTYTVRIGKDAMHPGGMKMEKDFEMSFLTNDYNTFEILQKSPSEGEKVHFASPILEFRFQSHLDGEDIQREILVKDKSGETLKYNARSIKCSRFGDEFGFFQVKLSDNFNIGETYTVDVASTVCDPDGIKIEGPLNYEFTAVDAAVDPVELALVDALDGTGTLVTDEAASAGCKSWTVACDTETKLEGTSSYKLSYTFNEVTGGVAASNFATAPATTFSKSDMISMKVYGDLSGNDLVAKFSNGSEEKTKTICNLNFLGWHHVDASLAEGLGDAAYTLTGFEIVQRGLACGKTGNVYLDKIGKGDASHAGVSDIEVVGLRLYPNPASELLVANADCHILGIELVSMDGRVVASRGGNVLNVSEIADGVYVAKIHVMGGSATRQVVIKH